jgi:hypothetical protein
MGHVRRPHNPSADVRPGSPGIRTWAYHPAMTSVESVSLDPQQTVEGKLWASRLGGLPMILRIVWVVAVGITACSHARAAEKTMPINFIGEWCFSAQENKTTSYTLPSWTEDGRCTKILSIEPYGFFGEGRNCEPVKYAAQKGYRTLWHRLHCYDHRQLPTRRSRDGRCAPNLRVQSLQRQPDGHHEIEIAKRRGSDVQPLPASVPRVFAGRRQG